VYRVLRRVFGLKEDEVVGGWRRLHNKELHNLYASPDIVSAQNVLVVMCGACRTHKRDEKFIQNFGRKT
jgi:hypothetical protein